ncbi:hypothetical protein JVT61DRAFT_1010 [Boletus reticuloceps]|uniref:Uncharacterized protein n=1 Tax=Boletus reticuloceps TaxID=495285 RepID=A0A8I3AC63_9AGAM|nr:hypothetical protein JVT61DRAFT_1010 [Boletus reticuloceps]
MAIPDTEKPSQVPETKLGINLKDESLYNQRLRRKVDGRLLPILTLLFLLSFLDRWALSGI